MKKDELVRFAVDYLKNEGFTVSSSTGSAIKSSQFINPTMLDKMDDSKIKSNTRIIMAEAIGEYKERKAKSPNVYKIRDIDVQPALRRRFCSLPPFCRGV